MVCGPTYFRNISFNSSNYFCYCGSNIIDSKVHTAQYVDTMSKNISLTLATQEAIDRKLEMRVDALEEAIMHTGTELQALKVKMALSCHADYRWICVTSLKVNETDY